MYDAQDGWGGDSHCSHGRVPASSVNLPPREFFDFKGGMERGKMAEVTRVEKVAIDLLIPYVNNAKIHNKEQIEKLAASIREFGFLSPVLIDKDYNIIAGHGRVMAAKKINVTEVPCVFIEGLTEAQRKAYILADNRLGELADWDMDLVNAELEQLIDSSFDIDLTGFEYDPDEAPSDVVEDNFEVELPEEPKAKLGDIYQLGNHRLMCGDSTSVTDLDKLMDGNLARCVCTDPPYNMAYEGAGNTADSKRKKNRILNDNMSSEKFREFLTGVYSTMFAGMEDGASCYVFYKELGEGVFMECMARGGADI